MAGHYLERLERGEAVFEPNGSWPWKEDFFPKFEDLQQAGGMPASNQKGKAA